MLTFILETSQDISKEPQVADMLIEWLSGRGEPSLLIECLWHVSSDDCTVMTKIASTTPAAFCFLHRYYAVSDITRDILLSHGHGNKLAFASLEPDFAVSHWTQLEVPDHEHRDLTKLLRKATNLPSTRLPMRTLLVLFGDEAGIPDKLARHFSAVNSPEYSELYQRLRDRW